MCPVEAKKGAKISQKIKSNLVAICLYTLYDIEPYQYYFAVTEIEEKDWILMEHIKLEDMRARNDYLKVYK